MSAARSIDYRAERDEWARRYDNLRLAKIRAEEDHELYRAIVRKHYLAGIECKHDAHTDVATCACSMWACMPQPSVGAAVDRWMEHVAEEYEEAVLADFNARSENQHVSALPTERAEE